MAPCIFELARSCVPTLGACNQQTIISSISSVRCDTQTHWASLLEYFNRARTSKYQREGTTCYTESYYFESGAYRYTDGTNIVATAVASAPDRRLVACDASTNFTFEEIASPECDEWKSTYLLTGCRTSQDGSCEGLYSP
jgi:D-serine deaminase-like pyridoxal phosphate-dependent protein